MHQNQHIIPEHIIRNWSLNKNGNVNCLKLNSQNKYVLKEKISVKKLFAEKNLHSSLVEAKLNKYIDTPLSLLVNKLNKNYNLTDNDKKLLIMLPFLHSWRYFNAYNLIEFILKDDQFVIDFYNVYQKFYNFGIRKIESAFLSENWGYPILYRKIKNNKIRKMTKEQGWEFPLTPTIAMYFWPKDLNEDEFKISENSSVGIMGSYITGSYQPTTLVIPPKLLNKNIENFVYIYQKKNSEFLNDSSYKNFADTYIFNQITQFVLHLVSIYIKNC